MYYIVRHLLCVHYSTQLGIGYSSNSITYLCNADKKMKATRTMAPIPKFVHK